MESMIDAQVSHMVVIFLYYLHLHGGWGLATPPYSHRAIRGTAYHHKDNNGDPPLAQGTTVARGWGQFPAVPLSLQKNLG